MGEAYADGKIYEVVSEWFRCWGDRSKFCLTNAVSFEYAIIWRVMEYSLSCWNFFDKWVLYYGKIFLSEELCFSAELEIFRMYEEFIYNSENYK